MTGFNTNNHVDVRVGYNGQELVFFLHVFDRYLWYDTTPSASELDRWDAVTVVLNLNGNSGTQVTPSAYRFVAQLNWWEDRASFQTSYRGDGSAWADFPVVFTATTQWRGNLLNQGTESRGWSAAVRVPFTSLGLSGLPGEGSRVWSFMIGTALREAQSPGHGQRRWMRTGPTAGEHSTSACRCTNRRTTHPPQVI